MSAKIRYEDNIAIIILDCPEARNALNLHMIEKLQAIVAEISLLNLRAAIFTGADQAFCAGADITELRNKSPEKHLNKIQIGQTLFQQIYKLKFLTLTCINAMALGGGMELALAKHI
ncbi:enoyl-CoA hydratase/isomerase family protein [Acinetobacter sp. ANC 4779]|uniref:enoyl-CoA hydratase/isomerase family protein n=1 Tax=Acinetobacter sp. ANC 4779 TaxID=2529848 RepID=UPI00104064A3|nr:enoyl-CoA hydratase/isomerase family protein [Acinetobacter sp. ANC 4779]TCB50023.1 enoyl-CoA hydratase/isomerase family protein [Acinetobacter sp. ANC 4779]